VGRGYPPFVKAQPGDDGTTAENGIRPGQISAADSLLSDRIKRLRTVPGVGPITALTSGGRIQISNQGGAQARWRGDGKELFYISLNFHARKCDNKNAILARPTPSCAH